MEYIETSLVPHWDSWKRKLPYVKIYILLRKEDKGMDKNRMLCTERSHLFIPNDNIVIKVNIGGNPDSDFITKAIDSAVRANESLNCKIVLLENGTAGYEKIDNPVYSVEVSNKGFREIIREEESNVFKLAIGELIRFFILNGNNNIELLVIAHHLAGDGLSIVYLIEDIMKALSGEKLEFKPLHILSLDELPKKSEMNLISKMLLKRLNQKWLKSGRVFAYSDYEKMFKDYWKNRKTYIFYETLSQNELELLCEKARQCKVSINSIVTTAFILAYGKKADTGLAVSIREKAYQAMANYVTGIAFSYKYSKGKSFIQNAQAVHKCIYKKLGSDRKKYLVLRFIAMMECSLIDAACMTAFSKYENKTAKYFTHLMEYDGKSKDISITNLTKLDIAQKYGKYSISNLIFIAPIIPNSSRVIGIATLGREINITMHVMDDDNIEKEKEFFTKAIQILKGILK